MINGQADRVVPRDRIFRHHDRARGGIVGHQRHDLRVAPTGDGRCGKPILLATPPTVTFTGPLVVAGAVAAIWVSLQLVTAAVVPLNVTVLVP